MVVSAHYFYVKKKREDLTMKKRMLYISHPSGGKEENTRDIEKVVKALCTNKDIVENFCIVSPVHNYGFMYEELSYEDGLDLCLDLLEECDIALVVGDWRTSTGCKKEISFCEKNNKPYIMVDTSDTLIKEVNDKLCTRLLKAIRSSDMA